MAKVTEDYTGKIVVVTGASRGIGKLAANHFLANGATVVGMSRGEGTIDAQGYHHLSLDISDHKQVRNTFFKIGKEFKTVDILVNNAAVLTSQYSLIMPAEDAEAMININVLGTFYVSREAAKLMKKTKFGRIINLGSMASSLEPMGDSIYAASKSAVITLANVMAKEFSGYNVTCNTIGISAYETDMLNSHTDQAKIKIKEIIANMPVPRFAESDDILNVLDFFASERSSYISAQTIYLGGIN